jgi:hypothetical protein
MRTPKTVKWYGKRYNIVREFEGAVCIQLHEGEIFGHVSRLILDKADLGIFWRRRIGRGA